MGDRYIKTTKYDKRYENSVIFEVICKNDTSINYIGSSFDFENRKKNLLNIVDIYSCSQKKLCEAVVENGGITNFDIHILHKYPCKNRIELMSEARRMIDLYKPTLNVKKKLNRTIEERNEYERERRKIGRSTSHLEKVSPKKASPKTQKQTFYNKQKSRACICGVCFSNYETHIKTNKHKNYIAMEKTKLFLNSLK